MKKLILAGSAVAALAFPLVASAASPGPIGPTDGVEGCSVAGTAGPGGGSCTYTPTSAGGFVAHGNYAVTVTQTQTVNGVTTTTTTTLPAGAKQGCAQWAPPGDATATPYPNTTSVNITALDNNSGGAVGDPAPSQLQSGASGSTAC